MSTNKQTLPVGTTLNSGNQTYKIESVIGSGGFGITYKASATITHGNVPIRATFAIKEHFMGGECEREENTSHVVYSNPVRERVESSKRDFIAEAKRLQRMGVKHDNIVKVNEVFEDNNTAYYVMEYLDGESLRAYVKRQGGLSDEETMEIMRPIIDAATCLHGERMTHLDIKPDNIMLVNNYAGERRPVLIDFGLSKHYGKDGRPTSTINTIGCSDGYAPIEQYAGITTFSPEADIYALGATAWFCLTGQDPKRSTELRDGELAKDIEDTASEATATFIRQATRLMKTDRRITLNMATTDEKQKTSKDKGRTLIIGEKKQRKKEKKNTERTSHETPATGRKARLPKWLLISAGVAALLAIVITACVMMSGPKDVTSPGDGMINGHGYVDLGLKSGLKWAMYNVGASEIAEDGDYLAWGDTKETILRNMEADPNVTNNIRYVALLSTWKGSWRVPTKAEWEELLNDCKWKWREWEGSMGYQVTGPNGKSIFLPAAGLRSKSELKDTGTRGCYWTATPHEDEKDGAYSLGFDETFHYIPWLYRNIRLSLRLVSE